MVGTFVRIGTRSAEKDRGTKKQEMASIGLYEILASQLCPNYSIEKFGRDWEILNNFCDTPLICQRLQQWIGMECLVCRAEFGGGGLIDMIVGSL